jgi:hypothetical protein
MVIIDNQEIQRESEHSTNNLNETIVICSRRRDIESKINYTLAPVSPPTCRRYLSNNLKNGCEN